MGKQERLFEPITDGQIDFIHSLISEKPQLSYDKLYFMITELISIPSIKALGKNEAAYIIDHLKGVTKYLKPYPPRIADRIGEGADNLPSMNLIYAIRGSFKSLGWDKDHIENWLKKYGGVQSFRKLDRKTAHNVYIGLIEIRKKRN